MIQAFLILLSLGGVAGLAILAENWWKSKHSLHDWVDSIQLEDGENQGATDPFNGWYLANREGMGVRKSLQLDESVKAKIDNVTDKMADDWKYLLDPNYVAFFSSEKKTRIGDCKGYARVAFENLTDKGLDSGSFSYAFCLLGGLTHAFLWLDTDKGVYAIAVGNRWATPLRNLPYTMIQRVDSDGWYRKID